MPLDKLNLSKVCGDRKCSSTGIKLILYQDSGEDWHVHGTSAVGLSIIHVM
jgi:hypothetical protein